MFGVLINNILETLYVGSAKGIVKYSIYTCFVAHKNNQCFFNGNEVYT